MDREKDALADLQINKIFVYGILERLALLGNSSKDVLEEKLALLGDLVDFAGSASGEASERLIAQLTILSASSSGALLARDFVSSYLAMRREEYGRAFLHANQGRALCLRHFWEAEAASFCLALGSIQHKLGKYELARRQLEEAIVAARRVESLSLEGRALMNLGLVQKNTGELREAERSLRRALQIVTSTSNESSRARCAYNLTTVLVRNGAWNEALELASSSAVQLQQLGLHGFANTASLVEARVRRLMGGPREAALQLRTALDGARRLDKPRNVILALEFLGDCDLDLGHAEASRERYREALLLARGQGKATDLVLECLRGLAAAELACGEAKTARTLIDESIAIAREQGDTFELGTSLYVLGNVLNGLDESTLATAAFEEARQIGGTIGDDHGLARASLALARRALANNRRVDAMTLAAESHRLFQRIGAEHLIAEAAEVLDHMSGGTSSSTQLTGSRPRAKRAATSITEPSEPIIPGFLTTDSALKQTLGIVRTLAPRKLNILVLGESGTGKELIAQAVHTQSGRTGPFVPVNCSAFPGDLIEGELFGHARGAYTGADRERVGLFEFAHQGTLFLDEIGDMPFKAQARLLRALEGGEVRRLGENTARVVDVRVVAATHRGLQAMVGAGEFRLDLYHRLAGHVVQLSPLRERPEDAKLLVEHFLAKFAKEQDKSITLTAELREEMAGHSWPGNVREIRLVMERLVALTADGAELRRLPFALEGAPRPRSLPEALEAEERRRVLDALHSHNWNKQRAANALGTSRTTLIAKMQRMGIAIQKP